DGIRDRTVTGVQTCALPISYLVLVVSPAHHALIVEVHRSAGTLCVCRGAANGQPSEQGQDALHALSPFHLSLRGDGGTVLGSTPNRSSPPLPGVARRRSRRPLRSYRLFSSSMTLRCGPIDPRIGTYPFTCPSAPTARAVLFGPPPPTRLRTV